MKVASRRIRGLVSSYPREEFNAESLFVYCSLLQSRPLFRTSAVQKRKEAAKARYLRLRRTSDEAEHLCTLVGYRVIANTFGEWLVIRHRYTVEHL